jgi:hypothetical protein
LKLTRGEGLAPDRSRKLDVWNEPVGVAFTELLGVDRAERLTYPRWVSAERSARRHAATRARSTGSRHARTCTAADASRSERNTPAPSEAS